MRKPRRVSPRLIGMTPATSGFFSRSRTAFSGTLPGGTSMWNTPDRINCIGLPLAPTTRSMPTRSRSKALFNWWPTSSKKLIAPRPRPNNSTFSAALSGRDHR